MAPRVHAIVLAGGSGERFGAGVPKQLVELAGEPILARAARTVAAIRPDTLIVVAHPRWLAESDAVVTALRLDVPVAVVAGGETRSQSVRNGIAALPSDADDEDVVAIHDAARPLVSSALLRSVIEPVRTGRADAASAAIASADTLAIVEAERIVDVPDRSRYRRLQTPQAFRLRTLVEAHARAAAAGDPSSSDDCGLVRRHVPDASIAWVAGDDRNLKITTPLDLGRAAALVGDPPALPAVILAAGFGRRLAELTNGGPKALLEVHGRSLLARELEALRVAGFERLVVVTGFGAEHIRAALATVDGLEVVERFNADFAAGNNILSFLAAADTLAGGFCLLNCDIVFDPGLLADLARAGAGNWLVVDGDEPLGAEEMKVELDGLGTLRRIAKGLDPATSAGEYIGLARFDAAGAAVLIESARRLVAAGRVDLYYEDAIDQAAGSLGIQPLWTRGRTWTEIDDGVDYARAVHVAQALDRAPGGTDR